jgi:hypothetical protein
VTAEVPVLGTGSGAYRRPGKWDARISPNLKEHIHLCCDYKYFIHVLRPVSSTQSMIRGTLLYE